MTQKVNYDLVNNSFIKVFLWFREHLNDAEIERAGTFSQQELDFWLPFFDHVGHLCNSGGVRFRVFLSEIPGDWQWRLRQPVDSKDGKTMPDWDFGSELRLNSSNEHFKLLFFKSGEGSLGKLQMKFRIQSDAEIEIEWVMKTNSARPGWFENLKGLITECVSLYFRQAGVAHGDYLAKIKMRYAAQTDKLISKKLFDPAGLSIELCRRLFLVLRLRVYSLLSVSKSKHRIDTGFSFTVFFLKAHFEGDQALPSFSYFFDYDQLALLDRNITKKDIEVLESPDMMLPGAGLCGRVARTKAFQYVKNWETALTGDQDGLKPISKRIYDIEKKFLNGRDLYEWPIVENGLVKYVVCLMLNSTRVLSSDTIMDVEHIILQEWRKISLVLEEIREPMRFGQFYKNELARMKGIYNHSFQQRFFAPIQVMLREMEKENEIVKGLRQRITMYQYAMQAIHQNMHQHLTEAPQSMFNLSLFLEKDIRKLFLWNIQYLEFVTQIKGYSGIVFNCRIEKPGKLIEVNQNVFEQALLQILTNTLEKDVFPTWKVISSPQDCIVELEIKYVNRGQVAEIKIRNNGQPVSDVILNSLNRMFEEMGEQGIRRLENYFVSGSISNRDGYNTGTGLLYSSAVFSTVISAKLRGRMHVSCKNGWTEFLIQLPVKTS